MKHIDHTSASVELHNPTIPPRPHTVAYYNFALSCNGSFLPEGVSMCCNNYRGKKLINPLFLHPDIEQYVQYEADGSIAPVSGTALYADIIALIHRTRMNYKELKEIRKIWFSLSGVELSVIESCTAEWSRKLIFLTHLIEQPKRKNQLADKYKVDQRWKTLMAYSWFHRQNIV